MQPLNQVLVSNEMVQGIVGKIAGIEAVAIPDHATKTTHNYWMIFLRTCGKANGGVYVGTLYNSGYPSPRKADGIGDSAYALMNRHDPKFCNAPQEHIDKVIEALQDPTHNNVYYP